MVVIAVMAILSALLLPTWSRSKQEAKSIHWVSNLRQIGLGVALHADEHEGRRPSAEQHPSTPIDTNHTLPRICDRLTPRLNDSNSVLFPRPEDPVGYFRTQGSGYEWNSLLSNRVLEQILVGLPFARFNIPPHQAALLHD